MTLRKCRGAAPGPDAAATCENGGLGTRGGGPTRPGLLAALSPPSESHLDTRRRRGARNTPLLHEARRSEQSWAGASSGRAPAIPMACRRHDALVSAAPNVQSPGSLTSGPALPLPCPCVQPEGREAPACVSVGRARAGLPSIAPLQGWRLACAGPDAPCALPPAVVFASRPASATSLCRMTRRCAAAAAAAAACSAAPAAHAAVPFLARSHCCCLAAQRGWPQLRHCQPLGAASTACRHAFDAVLADARPPARPPARSPLLMR